MVKKYRTLTTRVPKPFYLEQQRMSNLFGVPSSDAVWIREKILFGDFKIKRIKRPGKKTKIFEIEFD